jgi:hypothetical protein
LLIDGEPIYQYLAGDRMIRPCLRDFFDMPVGSQTGLEASSTPRTDEVEPAAWG